MAGPTPLAQLAETLRLAPRRQQALFARIAIGALIADYQRVLADSAPGGPGARGHDQRARAWRAATRNFLSQLRTLAAAVDSATELVIQVERQRQVDLFIGSQGVTLESPFLNRASALGDEIVQGYCLREHCAVTLTVAGAPRDLPYGVWSLGEAEGAVLSTTVGVQCAFPDLSDKRRKEALCKQIAAELRDLAEVLAGEQRSGRVIDWGRLDPASRPNLPVLSRYGTLPDAVRSWIRSRAEGGHPELVLSQADGDLARLLAP